MVTYHNRYTRYGKGGRTVRSAPKFLLKNVRRVKLR